MLSIFGTQRSIECQNPKDLGNPFILQMRKLTSGELLVQGHLAWPNLEPPSPDSRTCAPRTILWMSMIRSLFTSLRFRDTESSPSSGFFHLQHTTLHCGYLFICLLPFLDPISFSMEKKAVWCNGMQHSIAQSTGSGSMANLGLNSASAV